MIEGTLWVYTGLWGGESIMMLTHIDKDGWHTFTHFDGRGQDYVHVSRINERYKPLTTETT